MDTGEQPATDAPCHTLETVTGSLDSLNGNDEFVRVAVPTPIAQQMPRQFGPFELLEEIGRGGMGVVYKARQIELNRIVALKMVLSSQFASEEEVRRFHVEARAAGSLKHPHIVAVHEAGQCEGQHYFTMDYIEGASLAEAIKRGTLPFDDAVCCLAAVARAVDYLHARNIVHRDLKPSNILLDEQRRPYVTDFGLAKVFADDHVATQTGMIAGTPSYMAPEQAAGRQNEITPRTDVYSLGAILYEVLTGRPPFREASPLDTLVQVLEGEPTLPRQVRGGVPRELEWICMKCLEKAPDRRYASATALAADLERYLRREPIEARPSSVAQKLRRWAHREPALVSRLAALVVAMTLTQAAYLLLGGDLAYHLTVMAVFGVWAGVGFVFQKLLQHERTAELARFAWLAADVLLLTGQLNLASSSPGTLLIGYPLLVTASGLFFRERLVAFTTAACIVSFAMLLVLRPDIREPPHYSALFAMMLAIVGVLVAYQVRRVRALSRYYERRPQL